MEKNNNMLPIGTLLRGGTYRITRQLKSGGFGNTYVVENVHFDEIYAMKEFFMQGVTTRKGTTVSVSLQDNAKVYDEQKEKFKKEAQRIRKLNHPNIVKIYDLFEDNGTYYYVMDYIDGESLSDRLSAHGLMSESEAIDVQRRSWMPCKLFIRQGLLIWTLLREILCKTVGVMYSSLTLERVSR